MTHRVTLRLDAQGNGDALIDGKQVEVRDVTVMARTGCQTSVQMTIVDVEVNAEVEVEQLAPAHTPKGGGA